jgi:hypothetical protein
MLLVADGGPIQVRRIPTAPDALLPKHGLQLNHSREEAPPPQGLPRRLVIVHRARSFPRQDRGYVGFRQRGCTPPTPPSRTASAGKLSSRSTTRHQRTQSCVIVDISVLWSPRMIATTRLLRCRPLDRPARHRAHLTRPTAGMVQRPPPVTRPQFSRRAPIGSVGLVSAIVDF